MKSEYFESSYLLRAVKRIEGSVVLDLPAHRDRRLAGLRGFVECGIGFAKTVCKEHLPGGQFGIPQQNQPKLNEVAVRRALAATC